MLIFSSLTDFSDIRFRPEVTFSPTSFVQKSLPPTSKQYLKRAVFLYFLKRFFKYYGKTVVKNGKMNAVNKIYRHSFTDSKILFFFLCVVSLKSETPVAGISYGEQPLFYYFFVLNTQAQACDLLFKVIKYYTNTSQYIDVSTGLPRSTKALVSNIHS